MSEKATCPICGLHSSAVLRAMLGDEGYGEKPVCPQCSLSGAAMLEVQAARRRQADAELTRLYTEAVVRADKAESEAETLRAILGQVRQALEQARYALEAFEKDQ